MNIPLEHLLPLEEALIEQQGEIETRRKEVEEMKRCVRENLAFTRARIKQMIPDVSNQEAIMGYIHSAQQRRLEKATLLEEIFHGLKPADLAKLDPRAPIDRAFSRKMGRGGVRPKR